MLASLVFHLLSSACSSTDADRCCTLFLWGLSPCAVQALFVSATRDSTCKFSDLAALIFSAKPPPVSSIFVLSYSAFFLSFFPFFSPRRISGMYTDTEDPQSNMLDKRSMRTGRHLRARVYLRHQERVQLSRATAVENNR